MKYRDLENTCIYLKEFVSLLMEKRVNVEARWHKFIMNRALIYILDSLAYYNGRTSIPLERKSRFFERFTEMMVEIWPYVKTSPYRIYLMNSHKTTLETIFCSQWKILPPLYEGYQVVAQFNELVLNATDMELKMLKYLAETIIPQSSPSHFNSFQEANHFFSITNSVHIKQNTTQQTEKKQEYIKKISTWIKDNPMLSAEEISALEVLLVEL
ncbi:predicted protein [Naegleria gruberi]|uniref:Predicted protein n=1 Tax=Naegleria gruberi TaxID=5762 RepID=D2UYK6_NAEGR|nr:uncharacterized protein NAEGRDRAFT_61502 [Naegleria gruberi]EFC50811.1 predicted protein [Naegleria gruberi]|eukprot:XP_002683555.1 predicted protein [Naegleria gruberi strain NEG-M]